MTRLEQASAIRSAALTLLERQGRIINFVPYLKISGIDPPPGVTPPRSINASYVEIGGLTVQRYNFPETGDVLDIWPTQKGGNGKVFSMRQMPDGEVLITLFKRGEWERAILGAASAA
jgi:hypothetical protein